MAEGSATPINLKSMSLDRRISLALLPTPLQLLPRLTKLLDGPNILVKRDDLTGLGMGGNKLRKLEFLLGDALAQGADTILTVGALQSNHARQTAAACAKLGLDCELILRHGKHHHVEHEQMGNMLLNQLFGAKIHLLASPAEREPVMTERAEQLKAEGRIPYCIPVGGSGVIGNFGYVLCAEELIQQASEMGQELDAIVVATGSGGTHAGLLAGLHLIGSKTRVIGIAVEGTREIQEALVYEQASEVVSALRGRKMARAKVEVLDAYVGPGYGKPTPEMVEALHLAASTEALVLDPVYTGKAMAGLIDLCRSGEFDTEARVAFLHTGGAPGLFAGALERQI